MDPVLQSAGPGAVATASSHDRGRWNETLVTSITQPALSSSLYKWRVADSCTSRLLLEALLPLIRGLNDQRTLSPGKLDVLRRLSSTGRATITELASSGQVTIQGISLAVRELERMGLVTRSPDPGDRRRVWIDITSEGRSRLESEFAISLTWLERAIDARLDPGERATLEAAIPALAKLLPNLDHG